MSEGGPLSIVTRILTQEQECIPGYAAYAAGPGPHPGILLAHHAPGVTADYKIDAYRLAELGLNVLVPNLFNLLGVPGSSHYGAGIDLQAKHSDAAFLSKID